MRNISSNSNGVDLSTLVSPQFKTLHKHIKNNDYTHYVLKGGRGSTKSSFISVEIVLGMMRDPLANTIVVRKVAQYLRGSVYQQIQWAINELGVGQHWDTLKSPLMHIYKPTGQVIVYHGADDPQKLKSIKFDKGYAKFVWYEEWAEFNGMEEIRTLNQSFLRGAGDFCVFYSYNPPKSALSWVNEEVKVQRDDRLIHHSTYLDVPREWLGDQFYFEAEHLKQTNETAYRHEYLGEVVGVGGLVFPNVSIRPITDSDIATFTTIKRGVDFGFAVDPAAYGEMAYDRKHKTLYIFHELYKVGLSNQLLYDHIKQINKNKDYVTADSAEPKSIAELRGYGLKIVAARKGRDSVHHGIKFLQGLSEIIIDGNRCPNTAREFSRYEYKKDAHGNFQADYPDKDNHTIDMVRYALNQECLDYMREKDESKNNINRKHTQPHPIIGFGRKRR